MRFSIIFISLCLKLAGSCFSQTCVIAKITYSGRDTSIVIGADTKFNNYILNKKTNEFDTTVFYAHKLFNRGKITYATIGYGPEVQRRVADSVCRLNLSINSTYIIYFHEYKRQLMLYLQDIKKHSVKLYNQVLAKNQPFISQTIFAGFDHGRPFLLHLLFSVSPFYGIDMQTEHGPLAAAGDLDAIQSALDMDKTWAGGTLAGIRKLLKMEAIARPDKVGPPFEFYIIHKTKAETLTYKQ